VTLLLGLDIGTTSVKAGVFEASGRQLAAVGREYALHHPAPDRAELDAETYWSAAIEAVRGALAAAHVDGGTAPASRVAAIAVSSQGETVVAVNAEGRPLGPALVWLDNRAADEARDLGERFAATLVYDRTGVPDVNPTWTACKIAWWRRNDPELFRSAARFLLVEDFLLRRLTGRFVTEGSVACTSLLFDIRTGGWWEPMLEALGIGQERLPEIAAPGEIVGRLTAAAAEALGLPAGLPVVTGGMDQGAGAVGVGNTGPGVVSESTGGALTVQASVDRHGGDPFGRTPVYVHSAPGTYLYCPVCPTGGMTLTWFRDRFGGEEAARATREGTDAYDLLTALAGTVPAGSDGVLLLPHLAGAFSPEYVPEARGVLYGLTLHHGRAHVARAVLESVAFMLRRNVELLASAGATAGEIRSHGGGARSALWNQVKADVCEMPVVTLQGEDAAVRGDAMLAGVAIGVYPDLAAAGRAMVTPKARFDPNPANRAVYDDAYATYISLFDAVRPLFGTEAAPGAAHVHPGNT
jgi:sugar (pentulose or hexulose) kinase